MKTARTITRQKETGAHFTPPELAVFVARRILAGLTPKRQGIITVLDPSCGDGELLVAFASQLTDAQLKRTVLIGVESDESSLARAKERLGALAVSEVRLLNADFLELAQDNEQPELFAAYKPISSELPQADFIIANPPYVRTQILGARKAQQLAESFALTGRVDLYQAFLVAMTNQLRPGGVLGVITSNRFLTTKGGSSTRGFLNREFGILEVFDLGDTKLFSAAVLPAVFVGKRKNVANDAVENNPPRFVRIYEELSPTSSPKDAGYDSVLEIVEEQLTGTCSVGIRNYNVSAGILRIPTTPEEPWAMVTDVERKWIERVNAKAHFRICDVAKVRVGIKTTADKVFVRRDWDELPKNIQPENKLLHPVLSHDDAEKYRPIEGSMNRRVLYPHTVYQGKRSTVDLDNYPKAQQYLEQHRTQLEQRTYVIEAGRKWYEIWVPQDPNAWQYPKVVFPDISPSPMFFLDTNGCIVDGNCYWITLESIEKTDLLMLILGVANSNLMTKYHDLAFNNKLYSGRRRYLTQYVEKYPLPDPASDEGKRIIAAVGDILAGKPRGPLDAAIEHELEKAFGVEWSD